MPYLFYALSAEVVTKLSPFDNKDTSESVRFCLDKFINFLLTKLRFNLLSNIFAVLPFTFNLLSIELVYAARISNKLSFIRTFLSLSHPSIHLNVKDNVIFQSQEENFHKNKKI